jgi:hypothetical protein
MCLKALLCENVDGIQSGPGQLASFNKPITLKSYNKWNISVVAKPSLFFQEGFCHMELVLSRMLDK